MSSVSREASRTSGGNPSVYVERGIEGLWLLTAALVPLIFVPTNFMLSEAINAYVEVPKTTAFRFLVGLMTILWIAEWVLKGGLNRRYRIAACPGRIAGWLSEQPGHWVVVAAIFCVAVAIVTTFLSQSLWISLWGEVPGQFGYSLYTTFSYFMLFLIVATHLKTRTQLWRLLGVIVVTGALVSLYGILQHYGLDPLNLGEGGFTRVSSTMANPIFTGAVLVTTGLLTLGIAVTALNRRGWSPLGVAVWAALISAQFITVYWTGSRGAWLIGMPVGLVAFLFLLGLAEGSNVLARRRPILLGLLGTLFSLGIAVLLGQLVMLGQVGIPGTPVFVVLLVLVGLLGTLTGALILSDFLATRTGPDRWRILSAKSRSLSSRDLTVLRVFPRAFIVLLLAMAVAYMVIWLTPDPSGSSAGERLASITSETSERGASYRTDIWSSSLGLIWNRPWFEYEDLSIGYLRPLVGYGPELFKYTFPLESTGGGLLSQAHNFILHHWVEQGFLGLLSSLSIFVAFFVAGLVQLWRNRETYSTTHKLVLVALLATVAGRTAEMMVGVAREPDLVLFWIILAVFVALPSVMDPCTRTSRVASGPDHLAAARQERRGAMGRGGRSDRGRSNLADISPFRVMGLALASALVVFIGWLSWDKNVDYAWAAWNAASANRDYTDGKLKEAEAQIRKAIGKAPDVPVYYNLLAGVYDLHRYTAANNPGRELPPCEVAFRLEPRDDPPLQSAGPYDRCAWEAYESNLKGYQKNRDSAQVKLTLADSTLDLALLGYEGKGEEAVWYFQELTDMLPSSWPARNSLATAYIKLGREQDALASLDDALSIAQSPDHYAQAYYLRGLAQRRLDRTEEAIASFERSLHWLKQVDPNSAAAIGTYRQLADLYASLGDDAKAEEYRNLYEGLSLQ